ncbi:hypothetical protein BD769DRAFT_1441207 [Suillus cothurnatus]|nr:hypothetical protein BD769DRAFT_1441207 [Suillus cothurnatus]
MLSKYFTLFAALAAFVPAFAAPVPSDPLADVVVDVQNDLNNLNVNVLTRGPAGKHEVLSSPVGNVDQNDIPAFEEVVRRLELSRRDSGCSLADVDLIVSNVLNNDTINILTKRDGCDILGLTLEVTDVLNNLNVNILKRSEEKRYTLDDITKIVTTELGNLQSTKRQLINVDAIVDNVLNNLDVNVLTKRSGVTIEQIATAVLNAVNGAAGSTSKRSGNIPNVEDLTDKISENIKARAATKRADKA